MVPTDSEQVLTQLLEYEQITYAAQEIHNSIKYVSKSAQNTAQNTMILTKSFFEEIMVKINSLTTTGRLVAGSTAITLISTLVYFAMKSKNKKSESAKILETEGEKNEIITKEIYSAFQGLDWYSGSRDWNESKEKAVGGFGDNVGHDTTIQKLVEIDHETSKFIAEQLSMADEVDEIKTQLEISNCKTLAQKKMDEHMYEKIEDLL